MRRQIYTFVHASGTPRQLGRDHGRQAADRIDGYLDYLARSLGLSRADLRERALQFRPLFRDFCPHLLEEIEGLAEGAGLDPADALACQVRGEAGQVSEGACTSFVIGPRGTASGETLIGQTCDLPPEIDEFGYVLHLEPGDRPATLMWTFGGMIGYHGLNSRGVAHFANSLTGGPKWRFALSHYPLKRLLLEQPSLGNILELLRSVPVCSNGNYVLCDGEGRILDVELTSEGPEVVESRQAGFLAHANHYLCSAHSCSETLAASLPDSPARQKRIETLIHSKFGSITLDDAKWFLSDHAGHPASICRHPHEGADHPMLDHRAKTVTALIAEPFQGRLHVCRGNPCENEWATHSLEGR